LASLADASPTVADGLTSVRFEVSDFLEERRLEALEDVVRPAVAVDHPAVQEVGPYRLGEIVVASRREGFLRTREVIHAVTDGVVEREEVAVSPFDPLRADLDLVEGVDVVGNVDLAVGRRRRARRDPCSWVDCGTDTQCVWRRGNG
jgi:hypothetical protein